jgi:hypothetical protein
LNLLANAESDVLRTLAAKLGEVAELLRAGRTASDEWTLATGHAVHRQLAALARARATARVNARVASRCSERQPVCRRAGLRPRGVLTVPRIAALNSPP